MMILLVSTWRSSEKLIVWLWLRSEKYSSKVKWKASIYQNSKIKSIKKSRINWSISHLLNSNLCFKPRNLIHMNYFYTFSSFTQLIKNTPFFSICMLFLPTGTTGWKANLLKNNWSSWFLREFLKWDLLTLLKEWFLTVLFNAHMLTCFFSSSLLIRKMVSKLGWKILTLTTYHF